MYNNDILKNILAYQKAGFENAYNSAVVIHDKTQGWLSEALDKAPYMPEQGKELVKSWMDNIKEARDGLKQYVSDQQSSIETLFTKAQ